MRGFEKEMGKVFTPKELDCFCTMFNYNCPVCSESIHETKNNCGKCGWEYKEDV